MNVSQDSVATYARRGEVFNNNFTANLPRNLSVEKKLEIGWNLTELSSLTVLFQVKQSSNGPKVAQSSNNVSSCPVPGRRCSSKFDAGVCQRLH